MMSVMTPCEGPTQEEIEAGAVALRAIGFDAEEDDIVSPRAVAERVLWAAWGRRAMDSNSTATEEG